MVVTTFAAPQTRLFASASRMRSGLVDAKLDRLTSLSMKFARRVRAVLLLPLSRAVWTLSRLLFKAFMVAELVLSASTSARRPVMVSTVEEQGMHLPALPAAKIARISASRRASVVKFYFVYGCSSSLWARSSMVADYWCASCPKDRSSTRCLPNKLTV
jgi:hypothetical protein